MGKIKLLQKELNVLLEQEDMKQKQRAKKNWFKGGDKNTNLFHSYASQHRKKNHIMHISNEDNQEFKDEEEIARAFQQYF